jgi:hypothetical protein
VSSKPARSRSAIRSPSSSSPAPAYRSEPAWSAAPRSRAASSGRRGSSASRRRARVAPSAQLVVDTVSRHESADRLDLPGDARGSLGLDVVAPERVKSGRAGAADRPRGSRPRDVDRPGTTPCSSSPASSPSGLDAERVLRPHLGIGDRLPEALGRRLDVDLEDAVSRSSAIRSCFHFVLQSSLEPLSVAPTARVLAHPPVVDEPDRDGVQEVELLAAALRWSQSPPPRAPSGASSRRSASSAARLELGQRLPSSLKSSSSSCRRVGSARALNTSSMSENR